MTVTDILCDGRVNEEVSHRIGETRKTSGVLQRLWKNRHMSVQAKVGMYKGIVEPSLLYACETWVMNVHERKKVEVVEMSCLRSNRFTDSEMLKSGEDVVRIFE